MNSTTGLILGYAGSLLIGTWGITIVRKYKKLKQSGIRVNGEIVDILEGPQNNNGTKNYIPVVKFTTTADETLTVQMGFAADKYAYRIGQSIPVIYDPENPKQFMVNDARSNIIAPIFLSMAVAGLIVCIVLTFVFAGK
jgi:hypothetical protein